MPSSLGVTAIVTTRDRPGLLADAVASIERQAPPPGEVRVADAGETPAENLEDWKRRLPLVVLSAAGLRAAQARNRAARGARGEVLAFLDDDDRWLPDHLSGLAAAL